MEKAGKAGTLSPRTVIPALFLACLLYAGSAPAQQQFSLQFDGVNGQGLVSDSPLLNPTGQITVELWVKFLASGDYYQGLILKGGYHPNIQYQLFKWRDGLGGALTFRVYNASKTYADASTPTPPLNTQLHVAGTYDGSSVKIYVNGELKGTTPFSGTLNTTAGTLFIGRDISLPGYLSGLLDEVCIWNVARTQQEIQATMNTCLSGTESGLVAYWPADEGQDTAIFDATGNGNNGDLAGGVTWSADTAPITCSSGGGGGSGGGLIHHPEPATLTLLGVALITSALAYRVVRKRGVPTPRS